MSATAENVAPVVKKKGKGGLLAILAVAVIAIGACGFFLLHKKGAEEAASPSIVRRSTRRWTRASW